MKHNDQRLILRGPDRRADINALKRHIHALRSFTKEMLEAGMDMEKVFEYAMRYLYEEMKCERAAVFLFDVDRKVLRMEKMISQGEILNGEEEIYLDARNPLRQFMEGNQEPGISRQSSHIINVALGLGHVPIGLLRVEWKPTIRKISVLDTEILIDFARELTHVIQNIRLFQENQEHLRMSMASSEISAAIIGELRLEQTLHLIVQSILKNLGFDRVRLYLVDKERQHLRGQISGDIRGQIVDLTKEAYPLRKGLHKLSDIILGGESDAILDKYREIIVHVPLKVKQQTMGLLVADNLLSRQKISETELKTLSAFVGHIGMAVENARLFQEIEELSITDGLTRLYIYRYFKKRLNDEINRAERFNNQTTLIMLDIDNFKTFNDTYGHLVGDAILLEIANTIRESIRKIDFPARYGGDEFVIFLPHASEEIAHHVASRIFSGVKECRVEVADGKLLHITVSIGVASYPQDAKNEDDLVKKADEALYWAKSHGRNKLSFFSDIKQSEKDS